MNLSGIDRYAVAFREIPTETEHLHKKVIHPLSDLNRSLVRNTLPESSAASEQEETRRAYNILMNNGSADSAQKEEARFPIINLWYEFLSSMTHDSREAANRATGQISRGKWLHELPSLGENSCSLTNLTRNSWPPWKQPIFLSPYSQLTKWDPFPVIESRAISPPP